MAYSSNVLSGLFGIIMLLIIYCNVIWQRGKSTLALFLRVFLMICLIYSITDTVTWGMMGVKFPGFFVMSYIINTLCLCLLCLLCYTWLCYVIYSLCDNKKRRILITRILLIIPSLSCLFIGTTPFTHLVFYINNNNEYIRGDLYLIYLAVIFGMIIAASIYALLRSRTATDKAFKRECNLFASFVIMPLVGGIIQGYTFGLNLVVPSLSLSILLVYLNQQNQQQSLDVLTKLNNRRQFNLYMDRNFRMSVPVKKTFLLMIDIDDFKKINDTYGHVTGDEAIIMTAESLKKTFASQDAFLARYGGDEFVAVMQCDDEEVVKEYCLKANRIIKEMTSMKKVPYRLSVSIGYALFGAFGINSIDKLIAAADADMYERKTEIKSGQK